MLDLSLYVLDIARNSVRANAKNIQIIVNEDILNNKLIIEINDDGCGIKEEVLNKLSDPFYTTRTTRKIGLGIPFFKEIANLSGGDVIITSEEGKFTNVYAYFEYDHIDRLELGDIVETIYTLMLEENIFINYKHIYNGKEFEFRKKEVMDILDGAPLTDHNIMNFIKNYLNENINYIKGE